MEKAEKEPENQIKVKETSLGKEKGEEARRMGVAETQLLSGRKLQRKRKRGDRGQHLSISGRRGDARLGGGPTNKPHPSTLEGRCPPGSFGNFLNQIIWG